MIGLLWLVGIAIYVTSQYLYDHDVNIERVTGRFAGLRRSYFRMVKSVPMIGKRRKPFKALRGCYLRFRQVCSDYWDPMGQVNRP